MSGKGLLRNGVVWMNQIDTGPSNIYLEKLREHLRNLYGNELGLQNVEKRIESRINRDRGKKTIEKLNKLVPVKEKTLLDVGSGWGEFVFEALRKGAIAYGIEPDSKPIEISILLAGKQGTFVKTCAEAIPFRSGYFDIVICNSVIEHIKDIRASLQEMIRVLRKGGYLYLRAPNYLHPYEGHYKIRWIPLLPKPLARLYLRLIGRQSRFINHINYNSNYFSLMRLLKKENVLVRNLGVEELRQNRKSKSFFKRFIIGLPILPLLIPDMELLVMKL